MNPTVPTDPPLWNDVTDAVAYHAGVAMLTDVNLRLVCEAWA